MITSLSYCSAQLEKIDELLLDEENVIPLSYHRHKVEFRHTERTYKNIYRNNFIGFPVDVVASAAEIYIPQDEIINYHKYHAIRNKTSETMLLQMIGNTSDMDLRELVSSMIHEKVMNLSFELKKALKWSRCCYWFAGVDDNITMLRNVLNLYVTTRQKDDVQVAHLGGIRLPKQISDLITDIFIMYLSDRLAMLELTGVESKSVITMATNDGSKLKWHGKQQHLAELYLELEKKGWLSDQGLSKKKVAALLCRLFDLSNTKRHPDSNSEDSLYQLLKGETDKADKYKRKYFTDQPKYEHQFDDIRYQHQSD
ncbi:hypothetical protein [Mucilaginibacter sp. KACC 22063]|uniref:hypothetical protein n=1 Tax=Mucilaginibacter sp. KACC 22063 TaxID=3025666 RepID=UPI002365CD5F|nr:hypothetical protein [Mucilaginibacter sp. KACC 22063]WDF57208.1 hypothetical protein PQ461_09090 [Mucilaginibacter sp. KACC 22063]